jgi:hypothetical protein
MVESIDLRFDRQKPGTQPPLSRGIVNLRQDPAAIYAECRIPVRTDSTTSTSRGPMTFRA